MPTNSYQRSSVDQQRKRRTIRWIIEVVVCAALIIPAIVLSQKIPSLVRQRMLEKVILQPGSEGYMNWLNPPIETSRSYYLFNISNPLDVVLDPSKAILQVKDTPPYTYKVRTDKKNVAWSDDNKRIDYSVERLITRDPSRFDQSAVNHTGFFVDLLRAIFRSQFLFGTNDVFYSTAGYYAFPGGKPVELLEGFTSDLFKAMREKMVGPNTDKSGFVYRQNGSVLYSVSIQSDLETKGQVNTFSSALVPFEITSPFSYPFPIYDSLTYPPMLFDKPALDIFHADFCRPVLLQYVQTVPMFLGMPAHEYRVRFMNLNNCTNASDTRTCEEVDLLDVSKCISASLPDETIFLSKAHFYNSSNETIAEMKIDGFSASRDKHDSVVYFEPYSGSPLKASFRMQLNVKATIDRMRQKDDLTLEPRNRGKSAERLVPIFWIDQDIVLANSVVRKLRMAVIIMHHGKWIVPCLVAVLSAVVVGLIEFCARRSRSQARHGYVKADTLVYH